jgi:disulfide bond formation protein DsbB
MIVVFLFMFSDNDFWIDLLIGVLGVLSTISSTYIATRLVKLSKPPDNCVCPATGNKMSKLTKIFADE